MHAALNRRSPYYKHRMCSSMCTTVNTTNINGLNRRGVCDRKRSSVSIRQHTSAYVSIHRKRSSPVTRAASPSAAR